MDLITDINYILLDLKSHRLHDTLINRMLACKRLRRVKKEERVGLHDHSLEVVGFRAGIETYICSNGCHQPFRRLKTESVNASQIQKTCFELALVTVLVKLKRTFTRSCFVCVFPFLKKSHQLHF